MEKDWPPFSECFQFKIGLMNVVLGKYPWEDDKYSFDFNSYYPPIPEELASLRKLLDYLHKNEFRRTFPEDIRNCPFCRLHPDPRGVPTGYTDTEGCSVDMIPLGVDILKDPVWDMDPIPGAFHLFEHVWHDSSPPLLVTPLELDNTKKYLNQVRNSRGYNVDCVPNSALVIPEFCDFDLTFRLKDAVKKKLDSTAILYINKKTDKVYQLEDILKVVYTRSFLFLVTFTAKVKNDPNDCDTFIATIAQRGNVLHECLLKPVCDAPGPDHYLDFVLEPIQVPRFFMKRHGSSYIYADSSNDDTSSAAALPGEQDPALTGKQDLMLPKAKRIRLMTEAETSQEVLRPPLDDSQCGGWLKASSRAAPIAYLDPNAHPFASTAEKGLTIAFNQMVEKWKSEPDTYSYLKSQAGVRVNQIRSMIEAETSQEVLRPPLEDSQCGGWLKACSLAAPMSDLDLKAAEDHLMRFSCKQHPSVSTAEKMLTIVSNMANLNEEVEKLKSQARSLSMDLESLRKDFSPLDPSIFPLQPVEAELLQTLPPTFEQNRDKGGGSSFHIVETSTNPEAEGIPSPLI